MFYSTTLSFRTVCRLVLFCFTFAAFHPANLRVPWTLYFAQWTFDLGPPSAYGKTQDSLLVSTSDATFRKEELTESGAFAPMVRLPGHVLPALAKATHVDVRSESMAEQLLTLTIVLKRDDQSGFDQYLHEVYDPQSANYRQF